ncbi:hypothetical protein [Desulfomonile tiedjei]|uniref:Uncharacterized protein n=1 Tax=Desulfomonile tiedjei (strain ATCC 49306 / DSM 6799 / DCB-1) TaxID=706587 RepID=I4C7J9_DESTA|nr:hypothetical protein [Desulfomonile tiedjei]AFM25540.1 hypothetical protein Desti_2871 [Desulfomonile tiedjei DSM 6799]
MNRIRAVLVLLACVLFYTGSSANAQVSTGISSPLGYVSSYMPFMGPNASKSSDSIFPFSAFGFSPNFRGELRGTVFLENLQNGTFRNSTTGTSFDFVKDLGFQKDGILLESMARTQLSRYALRAYYRTYLRDPNGKQAKLNWPEWRVGADFDLIDYCGLRLGLDVDTTWKQPTFGYSPASGTAEFIALPRPVTMGAHLSYNPSDFENITPVVDLRYRMPAIQGSSVTEFEAAAGLKTPRSSRGTSGLMVGWRYTTFEHDTGNRRLDFSWSAFYLQYVGFY